jgi:hypothetical protein
MGVSDQLHTLAALPPGKSPLYPLDRKMGLDAVAMRKNPCFCREWDPGRPARSLVTVLTELFRLLCTICTYIIPVNGRIISSVTGVIHAY